MSPRNHSEYCAEQVRTYDYDRYFAAVFAPKEARRGLFALYAFNLEIASARERVSEPLLGEIRLQWWRDTLDGIYEGTVREHAVTSELAHAIQSFDLARDGFDRMIDGRSFDLTDDPPEDIRSFDNYVSATAGELAGLAFAVCGGADRRQDALSLGGYWGSIGLLRALPGHFAQRRNYLPKELIRKAGAAPDGLIDGDREDVRAVARELSRRMSADRIAELPKPLRPAGAYVAVATAYLKRLERAGFDVFAPNLEPARLRRQFLIWKSNRSGRV